MPESAKQREELRLKNSTPNALKRTEFLPVVLIGEGIAVGAVSGVVVLLYRVALKYADEWLAEILNFMKRSPVTIVLWFLILLLLALIVGRLLRWEPLISGSGIPQLEGEMVGKLRQCWWRVIAAKFAGGFLSLMAGLSLGREGPSIQLGAMAGKGVSRLTKRGITEEKFLLTCGASAGLSAAFHAPLAGVMFSLEELHKSFSVSLLVSAMCSSVTADFISAQFLGFEPVFRFQLSQELPVQYYWALLLLGLILGLLGVFYNKTTLKVQQIFQSIPHLNETTRLFIPFLMAGVIGFTLPELLGSGHDLVMDLADGQRALGVLVALLALKFLFSLCSFGSGAPGGIFFPLLVLGSMIGTIFATAGVQYFGMSPEYISNFIILAMAGYFTAIVRAPMTGIILIFEMTVSLSQMLSLAIVSIVAYVVATLLKSEPIYESLLNSLLKRRGVEEPPAGAERVLMEFVIRHGSRAADNKIKEIEWPKDSLIVALQRGEREVLPNGDTYLLPSDTLVVMTPARCEGKVYDEMVQLCYHKAETKPQKEWWERKKKNTAGGGHK